MKLRVLGKIPAGDRCCSLCRNASQEELEIVVDLADWTALPYCQDGQACRRRRLAIHEREAASAS